MIRHLSKIMAAAAAVLLLFPSPRALAWNTPRYRAIYIGSLPGRRLVPNDIDIHGDIVGYAYRNSSRQAFFYQHRSGSLMELPAVDGSMYSSANGINDREEIVGESNHRGVIWYPNGGRLVLNHYPNGTLFSLRDINNSGIAVGVAFVGYFGQAVRLSRNLESMQVILAPYLALNDYPTAINNRGVIIGTTEDSAFVWDRGKFVELWRVLPEDTSDSDAKDVNDAGTVVGTLIAHAPELHNEVFLYQRGRVKLLRNPYEPSLGISAAGIDNSGEIVGTMNVRADRVAGYLYRRGRFFKLSALVTNMYHGFCIRFADAINNRGWIAARGCDGQVYLLVRTG